MKDGFRQSMSWLHTWCGLIPGWVLFFVFVTGSAGYFHYEITRWMQPERAAPAPLAHSAQATERMLAHGLARLEQVAPRAAQWRITLAHDALSPRGRVDYGIGWEELPRPGQRGGARGAEKLDPATGAVLPPEPEPRATAGGMGLYRMHWMLHYLDQETGIQIVGIATMLMLLAIVSGVITHKRIFKDFFTFRPAKGQRSWLDAHNAVSVMALPFFLLITYSGLVFFLFTYMPAGRDVVYGSGPAGNERYRDELQELRPDEQHLAVARPGVALAGLVAQGSAAWGEGRVAAVVMEHHADQAPEVVLLRVQGGTVAGYYDADRLRFDARTGQALPAEPLPGGSARSFNRTLLSLHEGLFADAWGRWLYFIAGLLGCAMIATGLVLWTVKRRRFHLGSGHEPAEHLGLRLVEALNAATIAGLPLAVAGYFWANRLLPLALNERAAWEFHSLFAVWLATLFYALARPLARAWVELLWGACAAFALVPAVNALTADKHLANTLATGDWTLAGFDLSMLALAAAFAFMAVKVQRRLAPSQRAARQNPPLPPAHHPQGEAA